MFYISSVHLSCSNK